MSILKKEHIILGVIGVLTLAGCAQMSTPQPDPSTENGEVIEQGNQMVEETNGTVVEGNLSSEDQASIEASGDAGTEPSDDDMLLYEGALQLADNNYCERIEESTLREDCIETIRAQDILSEAVAASDKSLCGQLSDTKKDVCEVQFDVLAQNVENFRDSTMAEREIMDAAVEAKNAQLCNQIESPQKRENCQTLVQTADEISEYYELP